MPRLYTSDRSYDTPNFHEDGLHMDSIKGNVAFFFKPNDHRKISLQAVRSNRFTFSDDFINRTSDFINRSTTSGSNRGLNELLTSPEAIESVNISDSVDGIVDLNRLNNYWKFVIVLNNFMNRRTAAGSSHTVIINGRCVDEPVLMKNGRSFYNPDCELIIEGKSVFQSYEQSAFQGGLGRKIQTKSSRGWGYREIFEEANPVDMYENTPGGFNHNVDVSDYDNSLRLTGDPVNRIGEQGPSQFDRRQQLPGHMLGKTMHAINKTFREQEQRNLLPIDDHETSLPQLRLSHETMYPGLVDNIRQAERSNSWAQDQYGPSVNDVVRATSLETDYGVTEVKVLNQDNATFWAGSDQDIVSTRGMFESILATQLPTMMIESQIHSIAFEAEGYTDTFGIDQVRILVHHATPALVDISTQMLNQKIDAMKTVLEKGIFQQIRQTGGDFSLMAKINVTSTSSLALHWLDDGPADDHHHEFFPSDFALTTPMIGTESVVRNNQDTLGHFLGQVCRHNSDTYEPEDIDVGMSLPQGVPPRPRQARGSDDRFSQGPLVDRGGDDFDAAFRW